MRRVIATVPSDARAEGNRAVSEYTFPNGSDSRAMSQKKNSGRVDVDVTGQRLEQLGLVHAAEQPAARG